MHELSIEMGGHKHELKAYACCTCVRKSGCVYVIFADGIFAPGNFHEFSPWEFSAGEFSPLGIFAVVILINKLKLN